MVTRQIGDVGAQQKWQDLIRSARFASLLFNIGCWGLIAWAVAVWPI